MIYSENSLNENKYISPKKLHFGSTTHKTSIFKIDKKLIDHLLGFLIAKCYTLWKFQGLTKSKVRTRNKFIFKYCETMRERKENTKILNVI